MKATRIALSVNEAADKIKSFLLEKEFEIFADIDHKSNAKKVDLDMPDSRVLIFGKPLAGTKLMQKDIFMSLDLPLRLAIVEKDNETFLLHQMTSDYSKQYQVAGHPVLDTIEKLFDSLVMTFQKTGDQAL